MPTLTTGYSLVEQAKRIDPDGKLSTIVEALNVDGGEILAEAPWLPSNDIWTNKTLRRGTLPTGTWRKLGGGVATEVSRTTPILDVIGMLETYSEVDKAYIDTMPSGAVARMNEAKAFIEGLGQTLISTIIYGNANADPDQLHGLAPRLNAYDGKYVINGGASGGTSIFVVTWGDQTAHLVYPKNDTSTLGIQHTDLGEVTITTATSAVPSTSQYQGYRDHFQVKCGLVVRHPRAIGRVANIAVSGSTNLFDEDDLITLLNNMVIRPSTRIYMNQTLKTQAEIALKDKANVLWNSTDALGGVPVLTFRGIPVRMLDRSLLLDTEGAVPSA